MDFEQRHTLRKVEAIERLKILTELWEKHGLSICWNENKATFHGRFKGISISGNIVVRDNIISGEAKISLYARRLGLRYVKGQIDRYLDPSRTLNSLRNDA